MLGNRVFALFITAILVTGAGCDTSSTVPHISERSRTSPDLVSFETCGVLEQNLKANLT